MTKELQNKNFTPAKISVVLGLLVVLFAGNGRWFNLSTNASNPKNIKLLHNNVVPTVASLPEDTDLNDHTPHKLATHLVTQPCFKFMNVQEIVEVIEKVKKSHYDTQKCDTHTLADVMRQLMKQNTTEVFVKKRSINENFNFCRSFKNIFTISLNENHY